MYFNKKRVVASFIPTTPPINIEVSTRSSSSTTTPDVDGCDLVLNTACYIVTASNNIISSGDFIYTDSGATSPFDGSNNYYKLKINASATLYICQITSLGEINVYNLC